MRRDRVANAVGYGAEVRWLSLALAIDWLKPLNGVPELKVNEYLIGDSYREKIDRKRRGMWLPFCAQGRVGALTTRRPCDHEAMRISLP